jgi:hypothetical protein
VVRALLIRLIAWLTSGDDLTPLIAPEVMEAAPRLLRPTGCGHAPAYAIHDTLGPLCVHCVRSRFGTPRV